MNQIQSLNWQPIVDVLAAWLGSMSFTIMLWVFFVYCLWGRQKTASWLEALGWNGIVNLFSGVWNGRGVTQFGRTENVYTSSETKISPATGNNDVGRSNSDPIAGKPADEVK